LYAGCIVLLARVDSIFLIAIGYLVASGMMVAVGPIARSVRWDRLHSRLRATAWLAAAQWSFPRRSARARAGCSSMFPDPQRTCSPPPSFPCSQALLMFLVFKG